MSGGAGLPALTHAEVGGPGGGRLLRQGPQLPASSSSCGSRGGRRSCIPRASRSPAAVRPLPPVCPPAAPPDPPSYARASRVAPACAPPAERRHPCPPCASSSSSSSSWETLEGPPQPCRPLSPGPGSLPRGSSSSSYRDPGGARWPLAAGVRGPGSPR